MTMNGGEITNTSLLESTKNFSESENITNNIIHSLQPANPNLEIGEKEFIYDNKINKTEANIVSKLLQEERDDETNMLPKTPEQLLQEDNIILVSRLNDIIVGFVMLMPIKDDNGETMCYEKGSAFVQPQFREKGVGGNLVNMILTANKQKSIFSLTNNKKRSLISKNIEVGQNILALDTHKKIDKNGNLTLLGKIFKYREDEGYDISDKNNVLICNPVFHEQMTKPNKQIIEFNQQMTKLHEQMIKFKMIK